ncbi:2381_t:CDS:2, partial [Funneliformis geosporum]
FTETIISWCINPWIISVKIRMAILRIIHDYISDIMAFYYPSMFNNLSNLCFSDQ